MKIILLLKIRTLVLVFYHRLCASVICYTLTETDSTITQTRQLLAYGDSDVDKRNITISINSNRFCSIH